MMRHSFRGGSAGGKLSVLAHVGSGEVTTPGSAQKNVWLLPLVTWFSVECGGVAGLVVGFDHPQGPFQP